MELAKPITENIFGTKVSRLKDYAPLVIAVAITIIATYLLELLRSDNGLVYFHELMNTFMGFFFLVFAVPKLFNLQGFASAFAQYDLISKRYPLYAKLYPFIEIGLAVVLITNLPMYSLPLNLVVNTSIVVLTLLGIVGITQSLRMKKHIDCACLGAKFTFPLSNVTIIENGLMLVMALGMIFLSSTFQMTTTSLTYREYTTSMDVMEGMK